MKFSELQTDKHFDLLCDIILEIGDIIDNPKTKTFINKFQKDIQVTVNKETGKKVVTNQDFINAIAKNKKMIINNLLKNNKDKIIKILSLLEEKTEEEIKEKPLFETIALIMEYSKDKELMGFFKSQIKSEVIN